MREGLEEEMPKQGRPLQVTYQRPEENVVLKALFDPLEVLAPPLLLCDTLTSGGSQNAT